jgi:hypothetical protein
MSLARFQKVPANSDNREGGRMRAKPLLTPKLDRTQEVAGSSPASSTYETPWKQGVFSFMDPVGIA